MFMRRRIRDPHLGPVEAEMLRYIADNPGATGRQVCDKFAESHGSGRTTTLKTLDRLRQKGYVDRDDSDGAISYRSKMSREELDAYVVEDFVHISLGGSIEPLVSFLVQQRKMSPEQVEQMRKLIDGLDGLK